MFALRGQLRRVDVRLGRVSWSFRYFSTSGWPSTPPAALIMAIVFAAASAGASNGHVLRQVDGGADHDRRAGRLVLGGRARGADGKHGERPPWRDCNPDDSCESHAPSLLVEVMGTSCRVLAHPGEVGSVRISKWFSSETSGGLWASSKRPRTRGGANADLPTAVTAATMLPGPRAGITLRRNSRLVAQIVRLRTVDESRSHKSPPSGLFVPRL